MGTKHRHRQSKNWWPGPDGSKAKKLVQSNSRIAFSRKISIYTGFGPFNYHEHVITQGEVSKYCTYCKIANKVEDAEHIVIDCEKFGPTRQAIFGDPPPAMNLLTDKQLSDFINETYNQGFPWFPPNDGEPVEEGDNISIMSEVMSNNNSDYSVTDSEASEEPSSGSVHSNQKGIINPNLDQYLDDLEISSVDSNQPGFALFDSDSESESEDSHSSLSNQNDLDHYLISPDAIPDPDPYYDTFDSYSQETDSIVSSTINIPSVQENFLISPEEIALPHPMFGALNYDNFLLGPDDIASGTENNVSDDDADEESSNEISEEFEFNDMYIDDDIYSFRFEPNQDPEPSPFRANFDPENDSDLDHYLLGPDGVYLDETSEISFDSVPDLDPEPSPGPVNPG